MGSAKKGTSLGLVRTLTGTSAKSYEPAKKGTSLEFARNVTGRQKAKKESLQHSGFPAGHPREY